MNYQKKFERAAQRRKYLALAAAILLHLAVFAAITNPDSWQEFIPDFLMELLHGEQGVAPLPRP